MIEITCFYIHSSDPIAFTFIKYKKFIKIVLNDRQIILEIENLKYYELISKFYILSLLVFKKIYIKDDKLIIYGFSMDNNNN